MLRGGGLCVAGPGDPALNKVSPRIRALQDRLIDSLPSDGAWECLSPAQREAILSLHRSRTTSTDDSSEHGEGGLRRPLRSHAAFARFTRSRSYDDRLESETDDSGVRGSGATSHNSIEEDSSDNCLRRGLGRHSKALEGKAGRAAREGKHDRAGHKGEGKGLGNVNKMISKQMGKASAPSNITLDCRNVHGEKRRRSRVDVDGPFRDLESIRERDQENVVPQAIRPRPGPARRTPLAECDVQMRGIKDSNFHPLRGVKGNVSSEEYDSGVNLKHEDSTDEYMKSQQNRGELECDRTPRSDSSPSPTSPRSYSDDLTTGRSSAEREASRGWDNSGNRTRSREGRGGRGPAEPRKKTGQNNKLNSAFDYRTSLNQEAGRYSSNWNNIILSRKVPIKSVGAPPRESRFTKNTAGGGGGVTRSSGNVASKSAAAAANRKPEALNWMVMDPSRMADRPASRKYLRSKSLDRKYLEDDSSDEDSDFETRRRTERVRRQQRVCQEWESGRGRLLQDRGRQRGPVKAKSDWDITGQEGKVQDDFDDFDNIGFRTRSDFRSRWENEDRRQKVSDHIQEGRGVPGNRRSCDFELEFARQDLDMISNDKVDFDRKRWYRRSCDLDLDFELHHGRQRREDSPDVVWNRRSQEYPMPMEAELLPAVTKRGGGQFYEPHMMELHAPSRNRGRCEDMITDETFHLEVEGRRPRRDDLDEEESGRRTRLEDYYRSRTSLGHRGNDKRPRSRTPHLLRENGVLSFENPNYTLAGGADPRLDDAINQNNSEDTLDGGLAALDSLYSELDHVCSLNRTSSVRNRKHYAQLDVGSMGVDVASGPVTNLDQADHQNNSLLDNDIMGRKKGLSYTLHQPDLIEHVGTTLNNQQQQQQHHQNNQDNNLQNQQELRHPTKTEDGEGEDKRMLTPEGGGDSGVVTDGGSTSSSTSSQQSRQSPTHIPHMTPAHTQDLYALPVKRGGTGQGGDTGGGGGGEEKTDPPAEDTLPPGWEKHEDNDGPYYWHIKSGTITRTPPEPSQTQTQIQTQAVPLRAERRNKEPDQNSGSVGGTVTRSNTSSALSELSDLRPRTAALDNAYKRRSYPARSDITDGNGGRPIRFAVLSLGWVEIAEEDLTPERSSKAVNRCIVDLSVGRRDLLDVVGCWGDGKDLFMDLDEGSLKLVDPENLTVLNTQPIHTIRVWGVGRDNGRERDFAYVARDRVSRKHMCHVFRCDTPARIIANTLRDICKKIMIERSLQQNLNKPLDTVSGGGGGASRLTRPTNLPTENRRTHRHPQIVSAQSFPTPMEEPKKVMCVQYVGALQVERPSGMEVLNSAIERVVENNPWPWKNVSVAVAPSTVTVTSTDDGKQIAECRVRFLSFLGIGRNVRHCGFIMHTAQDQFIAYIFYSEPSTGALCKTIEAACKLRYQKCLDAHHDVGRGGRGVGTPRTISATLRSVLGTITGRKARSAES